LTRNSAGHTEFGEITQNKGHYTVQGHSRSPILDFGTNRKLIYMASPRVSPWRRGARGTISVKFSVDVNGWPKYRRRNIAENFNRPSTAHDRYRQTDDGQRQHIANVNASSRSPKTVHHVQSNFTKE